MFGAGGMRVGSRGMGRGMGSAVGNRPTWSWDFRGGLPPAATFTRASSGWYYNSAGLLVSAPSNVARIDYDPVTHAPLGYLAEMQSTNGIVYSFAIANWSHSALAALSNDGTVGPDGATLAVKVTALAGAGVHDGISGMVAGTGAGNTLGLSAHVKQGSTRYVCVHDNQDAVWHSATFDFTTGAWVGAGSNVTLEPPRQLANGWWRLGFKATFTNNVSATVCAVPCTTAVGTSADLNYTAVGTETVYATGLQIDSPGAGITSYIPTNGAAVTRAQDILSMPLTSLPGWNGSVGGVLVAAYRLNTYPPATANEQMAAFLTDGTANNSVAMRPRIPANGQWGMWLFSGGVQLSPLSQAGPPAISVRRKQAMSWNINHSAMAYDGSNLFTADGTLALPVGMTTLYFGSYLTSSNLMGTIESVAYYANARSDAFVQKASL